MNKWTKKSLELANSNGYLDKLLEIYPIGEGLERKIDQTLRDEIKKAYLKKDKNELLSKVLLLKRFPFNNSYVASLRKHKHLVDKNPKIVNIIAKKLFEIGEKGIIKLSSTPKSDSRRYGPCFRAWLKKEKYPFYNKRDFKKTKYGFLEGSDRKLSEYAKEELGINYLEKGIDALFKTDKHFFIIEAKFITDDGGTQLGQFRSAVSIANINSKKTEGITIIDGIPWFESNTEMHRTIKTSNKLIFSAFLLKDFIKENS